MQSIQFLSSPSIDDATLVRETREGNRDAFSQIVARYQSLICSLAYSGTGSLSRSEDIAQETFVTAWKHMPELRDPGSLRAWLCGIARNLASNAHRRAVHEPTASADAIDPAHEPPSPESSPTEQVIRAEEEAILWSAVGRIPANYREPLILFYREQRPVAEIASALGLTEDAAKQRLSRGRALLHERVLALVEGTLARSKPGDAFTAHVLSALPLMGGSTATALGVSSTKSSALAKAGSATGGLGFFGAMTGLIGLLGGFAGWQMSNAASEAEHAWITRFWRHLLIGTAVFVAPALIVPLFWGRSHPWVLTALSYWLLAFYAYVGVPLAIWAWQNHARLRCHPIGAERGGRSLGLLGALLTLIGISVAGTLVYGFPTGAWTDLWLKIVFALTVMTGAVWIWDWRQRHAPAPAAAANMTAPHSRRIPLGWVAVATGLMAALLVLSIGGSERAERVSPAMMKELIAKNPEASVAVYHYEQGLSTVSLTVQSADGVKRYRSRADENLFATLQQVRTPYKTLQQGRDFETLGSAGRSLFIVAVIAVGAGIVILFRGLRNRRRLA